MNDSSKLLPTNVMTAAAEKTGRREMIKTAAALALTGVATSAAISSASIFVRGNGKPGEFAFLAGEWKIKNRRMKDKDRKIWDEFDGEATCWTILDGLGSVEELRIPARDFVGMGLRLLDTEKGVWNDYWVNAKNPVLTTPGMEGSFERGVGTFVAEEKEGDKLIMVKGVWDKITPDSCRWYQATSVDGGKVWQENWIMDWTRVEKRNSK